MDLKARVRFVATLVRGKGLLTVLVAVLKRKKRFLWLRCLVIGKRRKNMKTSTTNCQRIFKIYSEVRALFAYNKPEDF